MEERVVIQVVGQVMLYDSTAKHWQTAGTSSGLSTVRLIHYLPNNTFRIHGQKINDMKEVVLDSKITREVRYNRANELFIQWHDSQAFWGLNFRKGSPDAENFFAAVVQVLRILNQGNAQPQPQQQTQQQQQQQQSWSLPPEIFGNQQQPPQQPQQNSAAIIHRSMQQQQQQQILQQQPAQQQSLLQQQPQIINQQQAQPTMLGQGPPPAQMIQQQPNPQQILQQQQLHQHFMHQQPQTQSQQPNQTQINHYQHQQQLQLQQQQQIQHQQQQQVAQAAPIPPPPPPPPPAPPSLMNNGRINGTVNNSANQVAPPINLQHSPITNSNSNNLGIDNNVNRNGGSPNQVVSLASELAKCQLKKVNLSRSDSDKESECNNNHIANAKTTRAASLASDNLMNDLSKKLASRKQRIDQQGDVHSVSNASNSSAIVNNTNGINGDKIQESWLADLIRNEISKEITKMKAEIIDAIKTELRQR